MSDDAHDYRSMDPATDIQALRAELALDLLRLGVSSSGAMQLLDNHPLHVIERQLDYLPYRNAKRPEALIINAIRFDYSPPKELLYATDKAQSARARRALDEDSEYPPRPASPQAERYRTQGIVAAPESDGGLEPAGANGDDLL